jgi:hypothetical protein
MAITQQQIAERLLKKSQGVAETNYPLGVRGIGEEAIPTYNLVVPDNIWAEGNLIPTIPPTLANGGEIGVVKYYDKLLLSVTDGGTNVSFKSPELVDAISSRFGFGYNFKIFNNAGTVQIFKGDWLVDSESGTLIFYNPGAAEASVNAANPPRITFYKYIGKKGVDINNTEITLTGLTINGDLTVSGGTITGDGSGLYNIPASGVTGLNLDRISSGDNTAIMTTSGLTVNTDIISNKFVVSSGESTQFMKADGSLDDTEYISKQDVSNGYLPLSGGTLTGDLNVIGNITQNGQSYETHVEHIYSKNDVIILRDEAIEGLPTTGYTGIVAKKYDGVNDGVLVFDVNGTARVGDMNIDSWTGTSQPIATRDESEDMNNGSLVYWSEIENKLKTLIFTPENINQISGFTESLDSRYVNNTGDTIDGNLSVEGVISGNGSGLTGIPISGITGGGIGVSGVTIGPAEDGAYEDGIFTDFTENTPIGVAIDRFNEMFLKLAPTPPTDWNTTTLNIASTVYSARNLNNGSVVSITNILTPTFNVVIGSNGVGDVSSNTSLTFDVDNSVQETSLVFGTPSKNSGVIRYVYADPYNGQAGKAGFWTGFTSVSAVSLQLTPSSTQKTAKYTHSNKGVLTKTFYLDSPLTVSIGAISASMPEMNGYVSGIKTLTNGQTVSNISFNINNVSSYFYAASSVWRLNAGLVGGTTGDPTSIPTSNGETGSVSGISVNVLDNVFSDNGFTFTVQGRNSIGVYGSNTIYSNSNYRVDTVSNETERLTSGTGLYPTTFGSTFDSSKNLATVNTNELMLLNGSYSWPIGNYTSFDSPDYSTVVNGDNISGTQYRWATFNLGNKSTPVNNITLTIPNATIGSSWNSIKFYVKIGDSGWLDGSVAQSVAAPYNDGDAALDVAGSTEYNVRKITFGTVPRSGTVYVRIGISSTNTTYKFKKPTMA